MQDCVHQCYFHATPLDSTPIHGFTFRMCEKQPIQELYKLPFTRPKVCDTVDPLSFLSACVQVLKRIAFMR